LLFFAVALNFVALRPVIAVGRLRALAVVNVVFVAILLATSVIYQFPPPGVFSLVALVLSFGAMIRAR
jgi:hypothetical protein